MTPDAARACLLGIAQRLHQLLHGHRLRIGERVALRCHARRVDEDVRVGRDACHCARHVLVQLVHLLCRLGRLQQLRGARVRAARASAHSATARRQPAADETASDATLQTAAPARSAAAAVQAAGGPRGGRAGALFARALDKIFFSAASTTPSLDRMPTAEPAWLIASMAYSTCAAQGVRHT